MKASKKAIKKLARRVSGYTSIINSKRTGLNPAAYRCPGSRNPKKC